MGLNVIRKDSVKEKQKEKTRKQLQEENEQLRAKVESLTPTAMSTTLPFIANSLNSLRILPMIV